jgi:hypothetical protein
MQIAEITFMFYDAAVCQVYMWVVGEYNTIIDDWLCDLERGSPEFKYM